MKKLIQLATIFLLLLPTILFGQDQSIKPITEINVHSLGPQKLGNLPSVIIPPNNPQNSQKIQLGCI
ncbi:MAG TPA: hypothetical protein VMV32_07575 [Ignavibacteriaceae bacterium]|nr:hypothetical protein [Ignavibacteriaceae bacterium]